MKKHEVKLIKRTYRITEDQDETIKRESEMLGISESEYIRMQIKECQRHPLLTTV